MIVFGLGADAGTGTAGLGSFTKRSALASRIDSTVFVLGSQGQAIGRRVSTLSRR